MSSNRTKRTRLSASHETLYPTSDITIFCYGEHATCTSLNILFSLLASKLVRLTTVYKFEPNPHFHKNYTLDDMGTRLSDTGLASWDTFLTNAVLHDQEVLNFEMKIIKTSTCGFIMIGITRRHTYQTCA
jgi:hypothetical protein